jgi:hypothetical protein
VLEGHKRQNVVVVRRLGGVELVVGGGSAVAALEEGVLKGDEVVGHLGVDLVGGAWRDENVEARWVGGEDARGGEPSFRVRVGGEDAGEGVVRPPNRELHTPTDGSWRGKSGCPHGARL